MSSTKAILAAAAICLASSINAHMIMNTPTPYGKSDLNSSPLKGDGTDFPCKLRGDNTYNSAGVNNVMPIGVSQTLSFTGSAVHGGGSCQISLTTDKQPSKSSQWQVIHSIEGGCPSNFDGNLPDNPNGNNAAKFQFSIPEGIATGDYTLAWTWFNRIGNREMYMNCAPVTVTSGSGKREAEAVNPSFTKRATSFPPMFVANVGNGCSTNDTSDLKFPNPGDSVEYAGSRVPVPPIGSCATDGYVGSSGGSTANAPSGSATTPAPPAVSPTNTGGVFAGTAKPGSSSSPVVSAPVIIPTTATDPPAGTTYSSAAPAPSSAAPSPASSGTTSTAGALTGACTSEGDWNCIGGTSFQRCASGSWSTVQSMTTGTTCQSGQSANLNMIATAVKHKRAIRFSKGHVRRGHSGRL